MLLGSLNPPGFSVPLLLMLFVLGGSFFSDSGEGISLLNTFRCFWMFNTYPLTQMNRFALFHSERYLTCIREGNQVTHFSSFFCFLCLQYCFLFAFSFFFFFLFRFFPSISRRIFFRNDKVRWTPSFFTVVLSDLPCQLKLSL